MLPPLPPASLLLPQPPLSKSFGDAQHLPQLLTPANMMDIPQETQKLLSIALQNELDLFKTKYCKEPVGTGQPALTLRAGSSSLSIHHSVSIKFQQRFIKVASRILATVNTLATISSLSSSRCIFHSTQTCHILELFASEANSFIYYLSLFIYIYLLYNIINYIFV